MELGPLLGFLLKKYDAARFSMQSGKSLSKRLNKHYQILLPQSESAIQLSIQ